jgi:leucyl aminopeptidase
MKIETILGSINDQKLPLLVVNLFKGVKNPSGATGLIDDSTDGLISKLIDEGEITGGKNEITLIHTLGDQFKNFLPNRVLVLGLGARDDFDYNVVREISATLARKIKSLKIKKFGTIIHGTGIGELNVSSSCEAMIEGTLLGLYKFDKYKSDVKDGKNNDLLEMQIIEIDNEKVKVAKESITNARIFAEATIGTRNLVNEPPNIMTPKKLADFAFELSENNNDLSCEIFEKSDLEKMKMGAFLGVAQGSNNDPYGIYMVYEGNKSDAADNIWLIGKGITFDSGGLSLKPSFGMETMKSDMSGGAAVINAINAISKFKPNINVHALCLATENMPGGKAQRVGDVVTTMSGKTVEIMNTDAEGRLTLADAVEFAKQNGAKRIIDVATLTGAIVISLGHGNMGAFSNNEKLVKGLIKAGLKRGEPIWQLPLDDLSKKQNRSNIADIKNTGGRAAGSITAAHFIKEFVGEVPWVHLDIAGTAMKNSTNGWIIEGATGLPTRTLIQFVLDISNKS